MKSIVNGFLGVWLAALASLSPLSVRAAEPESAVQRGYRLLTTKSYLPPDFTDEVFDQLWMNWPKPLRTQAERVKLAQRRQMTFRRYGLVQDPQRPHRALGYVDDGKQGWVMNCLACHGGQLNGKAIPGLPNAHFALANLIADVTATKLKLQQRLGHMELGAMTMPLGGTNGTTNAVAFGVALESFRDKDMVVHRDYPLQKLVHHDLDAPPFWNVKKKTYLYQEGFVKKSHRPLLQFILLPRNDAATVKGWEQDYRDILAWIESLEPPKWPWEIDRPLAARGKLVFEKTCARCHGTYGPGGKYPNKIVPLDVVKTDPVRLSALSPKYRQQFGESWMAHYNPQNVRPEPKGYVAPPLDGIWASAPYLHNGSVPTLWHLLHSDQRPVVWTRQQEGYDQQKLGLVHESHDEMPKVSLTERRGYFDTRRRGKSAAGHTFPDSLTGEQKQALLEYLKTL